MARPVHFGLMVTSEEASYNKADNRIRNGSEHLAAVGRSKIILAARKKSSVGGEHLGIDETDRHGSN